MPVTIGSQEIAVSTSDTLVFGDNLGNAYFVNAATGTMVATQSLLYGNLSACPTLWNEVAFCPTSNPGSAGVIYGFDAQSGVALWSGPIQLDGSLDAPVAISVATLYAATGTGHLFAYDVSNPRNPQYLWTFDAMRLGGGSTAVEGLVLAQGGNLACLITQVGVFAVSLSGKVAPALAWSSETTVDFTGAQPLLVEHYLYAIAGNRIYAWDLSQSPASAGGSLAPLWSSTVPSGNALGRPFWLGLNILLVGDTSGNFYLLDSLAGAWCGPLSISLNGATGNLATLHGNVLVLATPAGSLAAYRFDPSADGLDAERLWSANCGGSIVSAPYVHGQIGPTFFGSTVFQPITGGTLLAYAGSTGTELWQGSLGTSPAGFGGSALSLPTQSTAALTFLLDGKQFFLRLRDALVSADYATFSGGPLPNDLTFTGLISAVGQAGHSCFVLMWDAGDLTRWGTAALERLGFGAPLNTYANKNTYRSLEGKPNVTPALETYSTAARFWDEPFALGSSNHQKLVIVSVAGTRLALVGGLNVVTPEYWDTPDHPMKGSNLHNWHDTALVLQGPAVDLVEREFDRRWTKVKGSAPQPDGTTYVKTAFWEVVGTSCLDDYGVCHEGKPPTRFSNPSVTSTQVPVAVLLTNAERSSGIQQIREGLIAAISNAVSYAYFENVAFYDVALVEALADRLNGSAGARLIVIINIPQPLTTNDNIQQAYFALSKIAFQALLLRIGTWTSFTVDTGSTVQRSQLWSSWVTLSANEIERSTISFQTQANGLTYSYPISRLTSVASSDARVIFCGPARYFATPPASTARIMPGWATNYRGIYVHSKLALFDDSIAFVGSANFTERSMRQDGEISIAISDSATATSIRESLFSHWGQTTAASWATAMAAFQSTSTDGVGVLPLPPSSLPGNAALSYVAWMMTAFTEV